MPVELKSSLAAYIEAARWAAPDFRWVAADKLHLTLQFLGNVAPSTVECIGAGLGAIQLPAPTLRLARTGTFGGSRRARVIWVGLEGDVVRVRELAAAVEATSRDCGVEPEQRPFRPHVTLARARERSGAPAPTIAPLPDMPGWMGDQVVLYESRLGRGGPTYLPLRRFELQPGS